MNLVEKLLSVKPFTCPNCGKELPLADVNVAQDMALCRACGYTGSFLGATVGSADDRRGDGASAEAGEPAAGVRRRADDHVPAEADGAAVPGSVHGPLVGGFDGGDLRRADLATGQFDWKLGLFGLPFLIGTIVLVIVDPVHACSAKTTVTLSKGRVQVFMGVFGLGRTREMECGKGTTVTIEKSSYRVNNVPQPEIVLTSGEKKLKFGAMGLSNEVQTYVAAVLRRAAGGG